MVCIDIFQQYCMAKNEEQWGVLRYSEVAPNYMHRGPNQERIAKNELGYARIEVSRLPL